MNCLAGYKDIIKDLLFFKEPAKKNEFILVENEKKYGEVSDSDEANESKSEGQTDDKEGNLQDNKDNDINNKKKKGKKNLTKPVEISASNPDKTMEKDKDANKGKLLDGSKEDAKSGVKEKNSKSEEIKDKSSEISKDISENMQYMKKVYNIPTNSDVVIREFNITVKDKVFPAFMILIDGMTDRKVVNDDILLPLMLLSNLDIKTDAESVAKYIKNHLLPHIQLKEARTYKDVITEINFGGCAIFIEGIDVAFTADVKGWEHRGVDKPNNELVLRGPQEAFNEILRANTALIRKTLKDEDLVVESIIIGKRSKTPCAMLYIKDIANESLVNEVRRRLKGIKLDYLLDSGELEQMLEDATFLPSPQIIATERPDRVSSLLTEGKVAVVVNGSPFVLVMPATLTSLIHSPEDTYLRFPYGNFLRYIRVISIMLSLLLPGIYVAITNYHHEMIPTDLLFAIAASREKVPFPSVVEILIMELAFEMIREAGIRIPGPIGPTLGIIGALILGQAAVAANIVSPILIIIVAVTGIGSFAVPSFALAFSFRILRFAYIILGAMAGFLGITTGLFMQILLLAVSKSFGVPLLVPFGPKTSGGSGDELSRAPLWKQEERPDYLNTKDRRKQPRISRLWTKIASEEDTDEE